jgi:hypothetical protein
LEAMMTRFTLSEQDMIEILEDIAQNGNNAAARIAAIKQLREIRGSGSVQPDEFERLYDVSKRKVA